MKDTPDNDDDEPHISSNKDVFELLLHGFL